MTQIKSN